jgi:hypothetical protein
VRSISQFEGKNWHVQIFILHILCSNHFSSGRNQNQQKKSKSKIESQTLNVVQRNASKHFQLSRQFKTYLSHRVCSEQPPQRVLNSPDLLAPALLDVLTLRRRQLLLATTHLLPPTPNLLLRSLHSRVPTITHRHNRRHESLRETARGRRGGEGREGFGYASDSLWS